MTQLTTRVGLGLLSSTAQIEVEAAIAAIDRLTIELEKDDIVVNVAGTHFRRWKESVAAKKRILEVWLTGERLGLTSLLDATTAS